MRFILLSQSNWYSCREGSILPMSWRYPKNWAFLLVYVLYNVRERRLVGDWVIYGVYGLSCFKIFLERRYLSICMGQKKKLYTRLKGVKGPLTMNWSRTVHLT